MIDQFFEQPIKFTALQEYVLVQVENPVVEVSRRNAAGQVLSEYTLDDRLQPESVGVEITTADLYRQVKFETISPDIE